MILFYQPELSTGATWLPEDESRHCVKVLRKREGEAITVTDGRGFFYDCTITNANPMKCGLAINAKRESNKKTHSIHIAIAPTKSPDRMEWFVEKVTEMGIDEITLMDCEHSERTFLKTERLQKVAISAMKQSQQALLPFLYSLYTLENTFQVDSVIEFIYYVFFLVDAVQKFIAYVDHTNPKHLASTAIKGKSCLVLIGPEGDFSTTELQHAQQTGFEKVSLGSTRLRTETAGLVACSILTVLNNS